MPLNFISHNGQQYPQHEAEGNAARWIMPLAQYYCKGDGLDIGYSKEEWKMPGAMGIDNGELNAMNLPGENWDYIFSSHALEHIKENWYNVIDYWISKLKDGGIMFLYLPHALQTYWHPSSNRKHVHGFDGSEIGEYLQSKGKVFVGGCDANHSFVVVFEKEIRERVIKVAPFVDAFPNFINDIFPDPAKATHSTIHGIEINPFNPEATRHNF